MSKKAVDMIGETHLPDDLFGDTDGLNGLLSTYPDLGKGMGILDTQTLGDNQQPPNLPDGVVIADDGDDYLLQDDQMLWGGLGDLGEMTREASLADLSWLELAEQDPDRLPVNPVDQSIPDLEEAWGVNRRTTGLQPHVDREAANYEESLQHASVSKTASIEEVLHLTRLASRKVTAGTTFRVAAGEVAARLGKDASLAKEAMTRLKDDAGLIGKVFIRASDYPGCASGEWSEGVRKAAVTATYLVQKKACGDCVHAQNGSCAVFKKRIVAAVPWDAALKRYAPGLEATGRKVASSGESKEILRQAFTQAPKGLAPLGDARPQHRVAADQIGETEAKAAFAAMPAFSVDKVAVTREAALAQVSKWLSAGALSTQDAARLSVSTAGGEAILRAATQVIAATKQGAYSGGQNAGKMGYAADRQTVIRELEAAENRAVQANAFVQEEMARREVAASREGKRLVLIEKKAAFVIREMEKGLRGRALVAHVLRTFEPADRSVAASILDPVFKAKKAFDEVSAITGAYSGLANDTRVAGVNAADAWAHLRTLNPPSAIDLAVRRRLTAHQKVVSALGQWVQDGILLNEEATRFASLKANPEHLLQIQEKVASVVAAMKRGLRGSSLVNVARQAIAREEVAEASTLLDPILRRTGALSDAQAAPRQYEGQTFERAPTGAPRAASGPAYGEADRLLRWARQQMSEGMVGKDLDQVLGHRFAHSVRTAASSMLQSIRAAHEGLAGHIYVDAEAYASTEGVTGCEKGALKHRANMVPTVLSMPRCASCNLRSAKEDGTPVCSVYNKILIKSASEATDDPRAYAAEMKRLADGSDADRTAAMFSNTYDQSEFNLGDEGEMDDLVLSDAPPNEEMDDVFFGGMQVE